LAGATAGNPGVVGLGLRIGLLGPLSVRRDGAEVQVPAARQRTLLAVLAARAGQVMSFDDLAELIWDGSPPPGARATIRGYVKRVRQLLGPGLSGRLVTSEPGYRLDVTADELDLLIFDRLCGEGSAAARAGAALAWFDAEHRVLLAATAAAEEEGRDDHAWSFPGRWPSFSTGAATGTTTPRPSTPPSRRRGGWETAMARRRPTST
jgi:hypothetical protein